MSNLPAVEPLPEPETVAFWQATRTDELLLSRCLSCGLVFYYPRAFCPDCHQGDIESFASSGTGSIYACTTVMRGAGSWAEVTPYVVAYVELDEGPRIMTNIVSCDPHSVAVGQRVSVAFDQAGEYKLARFVQDAS
jgi:uncharacterized protein